jgi:hypothetical protein
MHPIVPIESDRIVRGTGGKFTARLILDISPIRIPIAGNLDLSHLGSRGTFSYHSGFDAELLRFASSYRFHLYLFERNILFLQ